MSETATSARLLCLDKPAGITSFDVVSRVRHVTGFRRVGHGGTLDPFATGVLVVGIGPATRLLRFLSEGPKEYEAVVRFGVETDTDDRTGEATRRSDTRPGEVAILEALPRFTGTIEQVPPAYSAIHVRGERSYRKARRGESPDLAARPVVVEELELLDLDGDLARLRVRCGGGTYIRALARDLGRALGGAACLEELRRTAVGGFSLDAAIPLDEFPGRWEAGYRGMEPTALVGDWPRLVLDADRVRAVRNGQQPDTSWWDREDWDGVASRVALVDPDGALVAVALREGNAAPRLALVLPEES